MTTKHYKAKVTLYVEMCGDYNSVEEVKEDLKYSDLCNEHPVGMVLQDVEYSVEESED